MKRVVNGRLYKGDKGGFAIVANDHPIFALGPTPGVAHARYVSACNTYFGLGLDSLNAGKVKVSAKGGEPIEQGLLV